MNRFLRQILGFLMLTAAWLSSTELSAQVNLPVLGNSISGTISTQQEYEFGRELLRSMRRQTPSLDDPLIEEYIASLSFKLAAKSELTDYRLDFILIDSQTLNAFAAPGGIIGVNAGLFQYAKNEGQFASVLAHELAHISQRHYARRVEEARNSAIPNLAATIASLIIMATVEGDAGQAALMTTQAVNADSKLRFSRKNEQEADRVGIRTLYNAGFDPVDMSGMFEQMMRAKSFSRKQPEFLSTHPLDENRIADTKNRAANYSDVEYIPNIEYLLMSQRVNIHYADDYNAALLNLQRDLLQQDGPEADATRYGIALAQLNSGQYINAGETLDKLLRKDPTRITYVMLEADIARESKNYKRSLDILKDNLRINPGNHPLTMAYAKTLSAMGNHKQAAQVLRQHSVQRPTNMNLWHQLAETEGLAGNIIGVHLAQAEYYLTIGELGRSIEQLKFAMAQESDRLAIAKIQQRLKDVQTLGNKFYR